MSETTQSRSPVSVGCPGAIELWRPPSAMSAGSGGRGGDGKPAHFVHALVRKDSRANGQNDGHGADHERSVRDGGKRKPVKLQEELQRNAEERCEQENAPLARGKTGLVSDEHRQEHQRREEEAVEDHGADIHLVQRDAPEVEAAPPERAGQKAGSESEEAAFWMGWKGHFEELRAEFSVVSGQLSAISYQLSAVSYQ